MKFLLSLVSIFFFWGCVSTKSTLKNVDNSAVKPKVVDNAFIITEYANDAKYGYNADYPINIGLIIERQEERFVSYFFNGLQGKNGEKITTFEKVDTCCPFPTEHNTMGAGTLSIYEVTFENNKKVRLYFNSYEKGKILCPNGFSIKK